MLLPSVPFHAITDVTMKHRVFIDWIHLVARVMNAPRGQFLEPDTMSAASLMLGDVARMDKFNTAHLAYAWCG